jgi:hypothetical protein
MKRNVVDGACGKYGRGRDGTVIVVETLGKQLTAKT